MLEGIFLILTFGLLLPLHCHGLCTVFFLSLPLPFLLRHVLLLFLLTLKCSFSFRMIRRVKAGYDQQEEEFLLSARVGKQKNDYGFSLEIFFSTLICSKGMRVGTWTNIHENKFQMSLEPFYVKEPRTNIY